MVKKYLSALLAVPPEYDVPICGLTLDSRKVQAGTVFFACQGLHVHGRDYIPQALSAGAAAILVEHATPGARLEHGVPHISVPQLSARAGELAAKFYHHHALRVTGVTGTNGKTSISHFIAQSLPQPCGLIGTLGYGLYDALNAGGHTTPDVLQVHAWLDHFQRAGAREAIMEVSSHALDQGRVTGVHFHSAVFTNLSRDHLDYHRSMDAYAAAKQRLFHWPGLQHAIINLDDPYGARFASELPHGVRAWHYSLQQHDAAIHCRHIEVLTQGYRLQLSTPLGNAELVTSLSGHFNLSNLLATLGALLSLEMPLGEALDKLADLQPPAGRMEAFHAPGKPMVYVDYAHTPDALEKALQALREHCQGRLWCVFGCGGDRDRGKRALMGKIAARDADDIILTDDNPRHEDPAAIIADIVSGMDGVAHRIIHARATALEYAMNHAASEDMILIAGKGHETYQQLGDQFLPFSDRAVIAQLWDRN